MGMKAKYNVDHSQMLLFIFNKFQDKSKDFNFCYFSYRKIAIRNPCQSSPSLTILVHVWFIHVSLVFVYPGHGKLLFKGFAPINDNFQ